MGVIFQDPTAKFKCTLGDRSFTFTVAGRLQRYRTVYRTILGKRMILISLRDSLRRSILERTIATYLELSWVFIIYFYLLFLLLTYYE